MKNKIIFSATTLIGLIVLAGNMLLAQKLPDVQKTSLWLPAGSKIDGRVDEWGGKLQAYNSSTELFYTIANNDKFLYLIVQTNNPEVIDHIAGGGLTLSVTNTKANGNNGVSITYPARTDHLIHRFAVYSPKKGDTSSVAAIKAMTKKNEEMETISKWIKVIGIDGLDTMSIYNEAGIQAVGKFDLNQNFIIEIVIPLQLIMNIIVDSSAPFAYQVRINGGGAKGADADKTIARNRELRGSLTAEQEANMRKAIAETNTEMFRVYNSTTDFWGEYTLGKK